MKVRGQIHHGVMCTRRLFPHINKSLDGTTTVVAEIGDAMVVPGGGTG
jgi:hypothetical protein